MDFPQVAMYNVLAMEAEGPFTFLLTVCMEVFMELAAALGSNNKSGKLVRGWGGSGLVNGITWNFEDVFGEDGGGDYSFDPRHGYNHGYGYAGYCYGRRRGVSHEGNLTWCGRGVSHGEGWGDDALGVNGGNTARPSRASRIEWCGVGEFNCGYAESWIFTLHLHFHFPRSSSHHPIWSSYQVCETEREDEKVGLKLRRLRLNWWRRKLQGGPAPAEATLSLSLSSMTRWIHLNFSADDWK